MKKQKNFIEAISTKLFSSTYQLQRIIILVGVVLVLAVASFAGYYYYDRFYQPQPKAAEVTIASAEQAVREDPQNPNKHLALAETYMINRKFEQALTEASGVMTTYPDNQKAWFLVGVTYALKGSYQEAIDPLQKYFDANQAGDMPGLNTSLQSAAYYLGDSYLQLKQPEKAVSVLEKNLEWSKTDADTMYKLGIAYTEVKAYDKALNVLHKATDFVPDFAEVYNQMVIIFEATNEPALAEYARGMAAYSKKDYTTAKTLLLKSLQEKPSAPTYAGLGMTYEALVDYPNAKASYQMALQLEPDDFTASTGLKRVEILLTK